jgi:hypothetical protein
MVKEDAFNASKAAYSMYGDFLKAVIEEVGMEKALSLHAKTGECAGTMLAGKTKEELGDKPLDLRTIGAVFSRCFEPLGYGIEAEETPTATKLRVSQCPFYEAMKAAGFDHKTIESMCSRAGTVVLAAFKKSYPQASGSLKFRAAPDQPCVEEWVLQD